MQMPKTVGTKTKKSLFILSSISIIIVVYWSHYNASEATDNTEKTVRFFSLSALLLYYP